MDTHLLIEYESYTQTVEMTYVFFKKMVMHYSGLNVKKISVTQIDGEIIKWSDIIIAIRSMDPVTVRLAEECSKYKKLFIYMLDDNLFLHRANELFKKQRIKELKRIVNKADAILTGNEYLFQYICRQCGRKKRWIKIDTAITEEEITRRKFDNLKKNDKKIVYYSNDGSFSDFFDILKQTITHISTKLPSVKLELYLVGVSKDECPYKVLGACRVKLVPHMGLQEFRNFMITEKFDIGLAPLEKDDPFRKCKYFNKFMEFSIAGIPGIYSNCSPYTMVIKSNENGFLCSTASEWEEAITMLLTNVESQQRIVDNAQRLLRTKFSVQAIEEKIIKQFPEILNYYSNREEDVNLVFVKQRYKIFCVAEKVFAIGREFRKGGAIKAFKRVRLYFNTKRQAHQDELRVDRGR